MKIVFRHWRPCMALFTASCVVLAGCSTSGSGSQKEPHSLTSSPVKTQSFPKVTLSHDIMPAGDAFRKLGETVGGGFVLMSGMEERSVPAREWRRNSYGDVISVYAEALGCASISTPSYYLIIPPEYQSLETIEVASRLDGRYDDLKATISLGAKTELYKAFSLLGQLMDITLVADNFIAESHCGEMRLENAPLGTIIEALLQSARISPGGFVVESTAEYTFIHASENLQSADLLLNEQSLTEEQRSLLARQLPAFSIPPLSEANTPEVFGAAPVPLKEALLPLTRQAGIEIAAQRRLADIPINPFVLRNVSLRTALNLLIRQWPLASFGYELKDGQVILRER